MHFTQILTQTYSESNSNDYMHTELVQSKFSMGTLCLNNHQFFQQLTDYSVQCVLA